jgi:hypothetical protein
MLQRHYSCHHQILIIKRQYYCEPTCSWMVRRTVVSPARQSSSPWLDIGARIIPEFISGFQRCSFSGRRHFRRLRDACGDFIKSQDAMLAKFLGGAHKVGFTCMRSYGWVYTCVCEWLRLYYVKKKTSILLTPHPCRAVKTRPDTPRLL